MTTTTPKGESLRAARRDELRIRCEVAKAASEAEALSTKARDELIERYQGPPAKGKFSFNELAAITGLSRTRIGQIIYGRRGTSK